jgi:predicted nucleic acid-binding protein
VVTTYFDSSVIVAAYVQEPRSRKARKALSAVVSAPFTPLLDLEVRTIFRRMAGSSRLTAFESVSVLSQVDDDVAVGRLWRVPLDLHATAARAESLSAQHAQRLLSRSLDLLHVAAALELGCTHFVTLDARQARLAVASGLKTVDLALQKPSSRRT